MTKKNINTTKAPEPIGPYSQAIHANDFVFTSGQIAIDPATGNLIEGDVAEQALQVLKNLEAVLSEAGTSLENVVKTTIYLKNMSDFSVVNAVYADFFGKGLPARSTVEVSKLPLDVLVEIDCIAIQD